MTEDTGIARSVPAGEAFGPWISAGPFYEDVSDTVHSASLFESDTSDRGTLIVDEAVAEARLLLASAPREGDAERFRGRVGRWELVRRPESYLSWGRFYKPHHLVASFLATEFDLGSSTTVHWRAATWISERLIVFIDGAEASNTLLRPQGGRSSDAVVEFSTELSAGRHRLSLLLLRISRMAQVCLRLQASVPIDVQVPWYAKVGHEERIAIERRARHAHVTQEVFHPGDTVVLRLDQPPKPADGVRRPEDPVSRPPDRLPGERRVRISLTDEEDQVVATVDSPDREAIELAVASALTDGPYRISCEWLSQDGAVVTRRAFEVYKSTLVDSLPGVDRYDERRSQTLRYYADIRLRGPIWRYHIWREVARYALGRYDEMDRDVIRDTCAFIQSATTGSDFEIQAVLRLLAWESRESHMAPELVAMMRDAVLGYKYWSDEPGPDKFFGSENHRLMYHAAELLAGQLYPTEEFTNSRQRGLFHATRGRMFVMEWLRRRGRFGFDEWHSNSYFGADIPPLVNLYDFCLRDDYKLKQLVTSVLDYIAFILASDTFQGALGTTHGRTYWSHLFAPEAEGTAPVCWLLYGTGGFSWLASFNAPIALAASEYRPPALLTHMAGDATTDVYTRERHGLLRGDEPHAAFCVYRTPEFVVSGLQDWRKGRLEPQVHPAHITLPQRLSVFWSCPQTSDQGPGQRPDYWSGSTSLPRVVQHRNVLALVYRLSERAWMSHCYFDVHQFDEVRAAGNWVFGRKGSGYVAIYSQQGMAIATTGPCAGRELQCASHENVWLAECGSESRWKSFDSFVSAISAAGLRNDAGALVYDSPSIGTIRVGWDVAPTLNGKAIQLRGYPLVESDWAYSRFGSGEMRLQYQDQVRELWFNL